MQDIEGVYVANVTPFRDGASMALDEDAYLAHVSWLSKEGVRGVVPFGTNGEGPSVTVAEKLAVLETLFDLDLPIQVIPTVMQASLPETLEMVRAMENYPAVAILVLPPYYFKPTGEEGLRRFFEPVLEATRHRIVLYHIPKYAVPVPTGLVAGLPAWGVKDSGGEVGYTEEVLAAGKGVLLGTEDDLWAGLRTGAQGAVSALANFLPEEILRMRRLAEAGDEEGGRSLAGRLKEARALTKEHSSPAVLKKLAEARHGVPMGTVRPPFMPVPADYDARSVLGIARKIVAEPVGQTEDA